MKVLYSISITCVIILGVIACTDKHEANYNIPKVEPGLYTIELGLNTKTEANTRGFDEGGFDGVYENNIIYIHSVDADRQGEHISVQIPIIKDVENKGFIKYQIQINEDNSYTIIPYKDNESLISDSKTYFEAGTKVYFASSNKTIWEINKADHLGSNVDSNIFKQEITDTDQIKEIEKELYRSMSNYTVEDLINLNGSLKVTRLCGLFDAFSFVTDMATELDPEASDNFRELTSEKFKEIMGDEYKNWYMKIYLGPCFTEKYNIETGTDITGKYAFFVTNAGKYIPFSRYRDGEVQAPYQGYGGGNDYLHPLIAPFDTRSTNNPNNITGYNRNRLSLYIYIKHWEGEGQPEQDWYTSDTGAKYYRYTKSYNESTLEYNVRSKIGVVMDVYDLAEVFQVGVHAPKNAVKKSFLRNVSSNTEPQEINLKNAIVICK